MSDNLQTPLKQKQPSEGRRLLEIEEATNRFFIHVLSEKLVSLARKLHLTPNMLSLLGMASGIFAGIFYYIFVQSLWANTSFFAANYLWLFLAFSFMLFWHICDGADGQLARLTNQTSKSGKIIDGICDYTCFIAVYFGIGLPCVFHEGNWVYWAGFIAGGCHAIQAASYELQREEYGYWAYGRGELPMIRSEGKKPFLAWINYLYQLLQMLAAGSTLRFEKDLQTYVQQNPNAGKEMIAQRYREVFQPLIKSWSLLSGNSRTLLIFFFCFIQYPVGYFLFEITIMTIYSFAMLIRLYKLQRNFIKTLP